MKRKYIPIILILISLFTSCKRDNDDYQIVSCPKEIKEKAYYYASLYEKEDSEYLLGAQDPLPRTIKMDCSGLIVMCYSYALKDTPYSLLEEDMAVDYMYHSASIPTNKPSKGDLIFMGAKDDKGTPTHIAIFEKIVDNNVYFIDATNKTNDDGSVINGITHRYYPTSDPRIKGYGKMKLKL